MLLDDLWLYAELVHVPSDNDLIGRMAAKIAAKLLNRILKQVLPPAGVLAAPAAKPE